MRRRTRRAAGLRAVLAAASVVAATIGAASTGSGAEPVRPTKTTLTPEPSGVASTSTTPADGVTVLTDRTGRLTISVPSDWTDTDVRPGIRDDGGRRPTISASPSLDDWISGWATPGMFASAMPSDTDLDTLLRGYNFGGVCANDGVVAYQGATFTGLSQTWSNCGGGATSVRHVAATAADNSFTIFVQIQLTDPDDPAGDLILDSVAAVAGANPGENSPIAAPATPAGAVPAALLDVPVPDDAVTVTDDLGRVSIAVPPSWSRVDSAPGTNDDFSRRPHLTVAPDIGAYRESWEVEGLEVFVFPFRPDPHTIIQNRAWAGGCQDGGLQSIEFRGFSGLMQTWSNCGGTTTRMMAIAVSPADQSSLVYVEVQLPTADDTALTTALASLELS